MKKAVIVGGSNGIGLAVAKRLIETGYHAVVLDKIQPEELSDTDNYTFCYCDLLDFDEELIQKVAADQLVEVLMITAGFGRVADFEYLHPAEIQNLLTVNTVAGIKIVRYFYDRIKASVPFYCGMMGSVAGMMSSPMFSVYAASKAAICRFIESVNIELEVSGSPNRILNCSPGSVKGTKFNGKEQDVSLVSDLAKEIVEKLFNRCELYIPDIDVYGQVLERYKKDPHEYGLHSYNYKLNSGRAFNEKRVIIGYLSGTFDLFHVGHLNLIQRAKQHCDYLIVGVHPSAAHKGKEAFIPFEERKRIVASVKYVDRVVDSTPEDSDSWNLYHYNRLFVGSDYKGTERFNRYEEYFKDKDVEIIYFPYTQGTSSTQLRKAVSNEDVEISEDSELSGKDLYTLHAALLIIADEIDRICRKNDINYSIIAGTMLGAIRHKGFIPWDDDMDIGFLRADYDRFLKACESDLDPRFSLQTNENDPNYVYGFGKILLNDTYLVEYGQEKTKHRKGIYVDIFPFDYIPDDEKLRSKQRRKNFILSHLLRRKFGCDNQKGWDLKKRIAFTIGDFVNLFLKQNKMVDKLNANMKRYSDTKTDYVSNMSGFYQYDGEMVPANFFDEFITIQFENRQYQMISKYDEFLKKYYGDYMKLPPIEKRRTHGFQSLDFGPYRDATFEKPGL